MITGPHNTASWVQQYRWCRSRISRRSVEDEPSETETVMCCAFSLPSMLIDTYNTASWVQQYSWCRSRLSWSSVESESSDEETIMITACLLPLMVIDTHNAESWVQLYRCWRSAASRTSLAREYSARLSFMSCIRTTIYTHRHWLHCIFDATVSVLKE